MLLALSRFVAQYGGGGSGGGGGGYSPLYWVVIGIVALVVVSTAAWGVSRLRSRRRMSAPQPESRRTDRAA